LNETAGSAILPVRCLRLLVSGCMVVERAITGAKTGDFDNGFGKYRDFVAVPEWHCDNHDKSLFPAVAAPATGTEA
jgi:alpha/beta superfamily hydrolase